MAGWGKKDFIEVKGLRELRKELKAAGESFADLKEAGLAAAEIVAETARFMVPVRTGALAASIRPAGQAKGAVVRAGGKGGVLYAGPIHFGWPAHNIEPQPFLYEAADARIDEVIDMYQERIQQIADNIKGAS